MPLMNREASLDWCTGCETPEHRRVNLPADWRPGDDLPENLTVHYTPREGYKFAFRGPSQRQDRVRLEEQN